MAPEYGATMGFFPVDAESVNYLHLTGRSEEACERFENYFKAQGMFGMPLKGEVDYSVNVELDLASVEPSVSGPKRPQDRINLPELKQTFEALFEKPLTEGGYGKKTSDLSLRVPVHINGSTPAADIQMPSTDTNANHPEEGLSKNEAELIQNRPTPGNPVFRASPSRPTDTEIGHGSVLIAAITSCTNTSNPNVMLGAGLLAKKAVERGLKVNPTVKTSMAPGSRVVTDYLAKTGLQSYLDQLGFNIVGYGCTTCIGNSGPLHPNIEQAVTSNDFVAAAVLSGNRNFEVADSSEYQGQLFDVAAFGCGIRVGGPRRSGSREGANRKR